MESFVRDREQHRIVFIGVGLSLKKVDNLTSEVFTKFIKDYGLREDQFLSCFDSFADFVQQVDEIELKTMLD